ncbi:DUF397 domain-containing protein [Streptomyces sp.]|uniref:DUF397 domain-containing protein n=1 Tax=Streptomyces sp. TaxID=1931 RepID=UPI002F948310
MHDEITRTAWRKAGYCNGATACVEVAPLADGRVAVRDSKLDEASPVLNVGAEDWQYFAESIASSRRGDVSVLTLARVGYDRWEMRLEGAPEALEFSDAEIRTFVAGVKGRRVRSVGPDASGGGRLGREWRSARRWCGCGGRRAV